jgi:hypothetical protein
MAEDKAMQHAPRTRERNRHLKPDLKQTALRFGLACGMTLLLVVSFHLPSRAQELSRRLILKDGSFQAVTKYEIKGDRVRYLSAERPDWEEMPKDLVDWPATEKYEKERAAGAAIPEAADLDKQIAAERQADEDLQPEVAPGVHLPEDSGVYLLDTIDGKPQLVEIHQNAGELNRDTKRNLLRSAINPIAGSKQLIELPGVHAAVQVHAGVPSFYMKPDDDTAQPVEASAGTLPDRIQQSQPSQQPQQPQQPQRAVVPFDRFYIVKARTKGGKRIVGDIKIAVYGKVSQEQSTIRTTISGIRGGWLKLTAVEPLAPGEYAIVEMLGKEGMNLYVWDFGVSGK